MASAEVRVVVVPNGSGAPNSIATTMIGATLLATKLPAKAPQSFPAGRPS